MPARRRIEVREGEQAVLRWAAAPQGADRSTTATAVRWSLEELAARYPGPTCEVRVPPFGVVQCLAGPRHTRGTPPNVVEAQPETWLALVVGAVRWTDVVGTGRLVASGERSDLSGCLPLLVPGAGPV